MFTAHEIYPLAIQCVRRAKLKLITPEAIAIVIAASHSTATQATAGISSRRAHPQAISVNANS